MGFDIMSLQKGRGPVQARSKADEGRAVLKYIDVEDLVPSEDNFLLHVGNRRAGRAY